MRTIEIRSEADINVIFVEGENTGFDFTKDDINAMLDDLFVSYRGTKTRSDLREELVRGTFARCYSRYPLDGGPLTADELKVANRLLDKACKRGWFS